MEEFEKELKRFKPIPKDQYIAESQHRRLLNQLAYLTELDDFLERLENVKKEPADDLHRELFKETPFQPRSFRNRVGRISSSSRKIFEILSKYELDFSMKKAIDKIEGVKYESLWEEELEKIDEKVKPIDERKYVPKISREALLKAIAPYKKHFADAYSYIADRRLGVLSDTSEMLPELGYKYEDALAKEGLIEARNFGTPTSRDIVGRSLLSALGIAHVVNDSFVTKEMGSIISGLGMCVIAVFIGR